MKVAYSNRDDATGRDLQKQANQLENEGKLDAAIQMYQRMIKLHYRREFAYQRLMIIYRQLKEYEKEMKVITEAIAEFSTILFRPKTEHSKKIKLLSEKLTASTGLRDKSGESIHQPEPIYGWKKRKERLEKLLSKMHK
ncbi:MAG: hypothetical protein QM764_21990 [Chitinophagaceae bacterium]